MKFNLKALSVLAMAGVLTLGLMGCGNSGDSAKQGAAQALKGTITSSGSSALLPLAKEAAAEFKKKHPDVSIVLNGGGSGTGLKQVSDGTVNIGNSDVAAETKLPKEKAAELVDHKVAVVTVAAVANKEVGAAVSSLTQQQLIDIFTGKVTNWKEVGGPDVNVVLVTRPSTSGTRALFTEFALNNNQEVSNKSLETDDSGALIQSISNTPGAIGYVALPYLLNNTSVTPISIDGVAPSLENTYNGTYKVWGYEHMYTKGQPDAVQKAYLDFIMSDEFGKILEGKGYGIAAKVKTGK
ncbi:phosphate ABC transporter substrate-binding protein [uncultured Veillonella sp.]|uniref:phosphate ABC transporter substrate-binding protein n=1 Tax=uncultured Veillonella sp. TaxID=159268 RepID=UPI0025FE23AC|nr:phosphate ABC transporter substrate-binding protein [uncultured Veillonella sp.]MDY3973848.1 phosphate ABC transporter substrate-binding protein [Veillonella caviae]